MGEVKLIGTWSSPFSRRVQIALKIKGIEYEFVAEDLQNKSEELLRYNPVHKKVPVLVHNGKPIVESLVILEYIDETWKGSYNLLPIDPYERSQSRFWATFIDNKLWSSVQKARQNLGQNGEQATQEINELLNILENEIKGKKYFGGNEIGYLDIVALFVGYWFPIFQQVVPGGMELLTKEKYPGICNWTDNMLSCDVIKDNLPDQEKIIANYRARFAGIVSANASSN